MIEFMGPNKKIKKAKTKTNIQKHSDPASSLQKTDGNQTSENAQHS